MTDQSIFPGEPLRYLGTARHGYNNGFRRRWLANGAHHAAAINAARGGAVDALQAFAETSLGGLVQPKGWVKSAVATARKLPDDIPAYRIVDYIVCIPMLSWRYSGARQVAVIEWWPMFGPGHRQGR